jgi:hypothetical protein
MRKEPQIAAKHKVPQASGAFGHYASPSSQLTSCRACRIKYSSFFEKLVIRDTVVRHTTLPKKVPEAILSSFLAGLLFASRGSNFKASSSWKVHIDDQVTGSTPRSSRKKLGFQLQTSGQGVSAWQGGACGSCFNMVLSSAGL